MPRVLLVLPTGTYRATDFLAAAGSIGAEVVVGSERRQAMAAAMGDSAVVLDLAHPEQAVEAVVELHRRVALDAIVAVDDPGVVLAALAGQRLGLAHNPPAAVAATRDKAAQRAALAGAGVVQPEWRVTGPGDDVRAVVTDIGLPVVVKPVPLSGSRGVIRADDAEAAVAAERRVRRILDEAREDPDGPVLVERYVPGREVAVEALLRSGSLEVLAVFDKPDPLEGPYFEETIYVTPSRLPPDVLAEIERTTAAAARALGLVEGPVHAELRVDDAATSDFPGGDRPGRNHVGGDRDGVWLLELAARSIGGLCGRTLRFGLGTSLEEVILRHALGLPQRNLRRERAASGVMMLPIPAAGVLGEVGGQEGARAVPGIVGLELSIIPGRPVRPLPEGDRYLGFLFARGDTPAEVEAALRTAHARLDVVIHPS